jgi:hypothetical protein
MMDIKMNDKIYELIQQSEVSIGHPRCFSGYIDINKFAELIVRECIKIVERDDGATELGELLLDHFIDWS